mmetsp:Transcript_139680/g.348313  ORF Transcript_139680/g.348313 Transcript_139680/m.348313 type:complete len:222 (-) Transcript_139680:101-766(-)
MATSKVTLAISAVCCVLAVGLLLLSLYVGSRDLFVEFECQGEKDVWLNLEEDAHRAKSETEEKYGYVNQNEYGYTIHIEASKFDECEEAWKGTFVEASPNLTVWNPHLWNECGDDQEVWESQYKPQLRKMGLFYLPKKDGRMVYGKYRVVSNHSVWVMDVNKEIVEAVSSITRMIGVFILSMLMFCVAFVMCLVARDCCMKGPEVEVALKQEKVSEVSETQ